MKKQLTRVQLPKPEGKFYTLPRLVRYEYEDGYSVTAPEGGFPSPGSIASTVGDGLEFLCKIFPAICNLPSPTKSSTNCCTVTTPQGLTITSGHPYRGGL